MNFCCKQCRCFKGELYLVSVYVKNVDVSEREKVKKDTLKQRIEAFGYLPFTFLPTFLKKVWEMTLVTYGFTGFTQTNFIRRKIREITMNCL